MEEPAAHLGALLAQLRSRAGLTMPEGVRDAFSISSSYAYWLETPYAAPSAVLLERMLDRYEATDKERLLAHRLRKSPLLRKSVEARRSLRVATDPGPETLPEAAPAPEVESSPDAPTEEVPKTARSTSAA